jgi:UDP-glucose 4-epimerase
MAVLNKPNKQRVLVTGSRGFIGSNLIKKLGEKIQIVTMDHDDNRRIDILDRNALDTISDIDVIIHLASKTSIPKSVIDPYDTYLTNIMGTLNILDLARRNNIHKIINISTFVYGKPLYFPIDEKHPINPHSPYTKSKLIAEKLCEYYAGDYDIDIVTLRPFYIYGPNMNKNSFIPSIIRDIHQSGKVILSNRNTKRDFLHVDDFVALVYKILYNFPAGYKIYNVGSGNSYSLEEVIEHIKKILEIQVDIEYSRSIRPDDIMEMVADITLLKNLFDWKPLLDIESGLRLTLDEVSHNDID